MTIKNVSWVEWYGDSKGIPPTQSKVDIMYRDGGIVSDVNPEHFCWRRGMLNDDIIAYRIVKPVDQSKEEFVCIGQEYRTRNFYSKDWARSWEKCPPELVEHYTKQAKYAPDNYQIRSVYVKKEDLYD